MHNTYSSGKEVLLIEFGALRLKTTARLASILVTVINLEIVMTEIRFLTSEEIETWMHNAFFGYNSNKLPGFGFFGPIRILVPTAMVESINGVDFEG